MEGAFFNIHESPNRIPVIYSHWYPEVAVTEKNEAYANLLTADLAAAQSEMTSVHQYFFQSWNIPPCYSTIRTVVERITQVELHHFAIIGQLITLLGGKAYCQAIQTPSPVVWTGAMIHYTLDIVEMLKSDEEAERGAADGYLCQSKEIKDPKVSKMLHRLSQDEQLHFEIFKSFLKQLS